jgi:Zn-dependent protease
LGRVTLNPVAHTDPIGTLLIPIINFVAAAGMGVFVPLIGWGKPTPVNPLRWRNKDVANIMVSLAGIMANLLLAAIGFVILKVCLHTGMIGLGYTGHFGSFEEAAFLVLTRVLMMNLSLAIFNLVPVPPLDGSKVLETFLPPSMQPLLEMMEQYGYIILMILIYVGFFRAIIGPVMSVVEYLLYLGV